MEYKVVDIRNVVNELNIIRKRENYYKEKIKKLSKDRDRLQYGIVNANEAAHHYKFKYEELLKRSERDN